MSLDINSWLYKHLQSCCEIDPPEDMTVAEVINRSDHFPMKFPLSTNRCSVLLEEDPARKNTIEKNINKTYPLLHESVIPLLCEFLEHKKFHGSEVEKKYYSDVTLVGLIDRLLKKRPVKFVRATDNYVLRNKQKGKGNWETIGYNMEKKPLLLCEYMSYDEIKLSAFASITSPSIFINSGDRHNRGVPEEGGTFEETGIIIGAVGPRLVKSDIMEWQDIIISKIQNVPEKGYGPEVTDKSKLKHIWARFYGKTHLPLYSEISKTTISELKLVDDDRYFDTNIYKYRIQITAETILLEANQRAREAGKKAYVHMVGLGLGLWAFKSDLQEPLFMEAFDTAFQVLSLDNIADVDFSWFGPDTASCGGIRDGEIFPNTDICLHFSRRNPQEKLTGSHEGKLLVVTYAWDGNAFPGNEYWTKNLSSSSDSAAACCSQISEVQNPYINHKVAGSNVHIASRKHGIISLKNYAKCVTMGKK